MSYKLNSQRGDKDKNRTPQGLDEVQSDKELSTKGEKFVKNGELYIRCGEQVFDMMGRKVK